MLPAMIFVEMALLLMENAMMEISSLETVAIRIVILKMVIIAAITTLPVGYLGSQCACLSRI
jgi:hypothetical protein